MKKSLFEMEEKLASEWDEIWVRLVTENGSMKKFRFETTCDLYEVDLVAEVLDRFGFDIESFEEEMGDFTLKDLDNYMKERKDLGEPYIRSITLPYQTFTFEDED